MKRVILLAVILISFNINYFSYAGVGEGVSEVDTLSSLNAKLFFPIQKFDYFQMVRNKHVNYYFAELIAGDVSYKECFYKH